VRVVLDGEGFSLVELLLSLALTGIVMR